MRYKCVLHPNFTYKLKTEATNMKYRDISNILCLGNGTIYTLLGSSYFII